MKKILYTALFLSLMHFANAQDSNDALRYSLTDMQGTARFRAMSGAFGALGGDFSSINVNPAGSAVFSNNQFGITVSNYNTSNKSNYFGTSTTSKENNFDINQGGGVFVFNTSKNNWKKFTLGVDYENTQNLNNSFLSKGINKNNSIDNYFLLNANNIPINVANGTAYNYADLYFNEQQAYLGYNSYILDYNTTTNSYYSNVPTANYYQENSVVANGYNGKLAFNAGAQYTDKWFFGLNLNSHFVNYTQQTSVYEKNDYINTTNNYTVNRIKFNNDLYTYGSGFSFQLGTIFKPSAEIRLALAYESPTWYKLNDELTQNISAVSANNAGELPADIVNPNVKMVYAPYTLQTPSKITGSFAYVFNKKGLLSIDYAIKDYSTMTFKPKNDFTNQNNYISNTFTNTSELRIGGEYKIKKLSLRGGYRWEQSPYKNGTTMGDLTGYSGGLGYNFGGTKLDLAYSFAKRDYYQKFVAIGMTDAAKITQKNNNITLSLLFEL